MNSKERREQLFNELLNASKPLKGQIIADNYNVTRQVIVKDIAILRAEGKKIIATPDGYIIQKDMISKPKKIIAVTHHRYKIEEEIKIVIKYGGIIKDVIVEHPVYGEIKANLMIKNLYDLDNFIKRVKESNANPLSSLTEGIHLHTIEAENYEIISKIEKELDDKGYLIK